MITLLLFTEDMIMSKIQWDLQKMQLEQVNEFNKIARHKINIQKPILFWYTSNNQLEMATWKTFINDSIQKQEIEMHMTKDVKDLYNANYQTLLKEILKDLITRIHMPSLWVRKTNIVKMSILSKVIYIFKVLW